MKKNFEQSSGNVFADLKIPHPEEALAKTELAIRIHNIIKRKKLTQKQAAALLGIDQPKISALMSGKLSGFSMERLFNFLNDLGQDVTISIKTKPRSHKKRFCHYQ
jgi:predicted XRE-type DNA-binding protein